MHIRQTIVSIVVAAFGAVGFAHAQTLPFERPAQEALTVVIQLTQSFCAQGGRAACMILRTASQAQSELSLLGGACAVGNGQACAELDFVTQQLVARAQQLTSLAQAERGQSAPAQRRDNASRWRAPAQNWGQPQAPSAAADHTCPHNDANLCFAWQLNRQVAPAMEMAQALIDQKAAGKPCPHDDANLCFAWQLNQQSAPAMKMAQEAIDQMQAANPCSYNDANLCFGWRMNQQISHIGRQLAESQRLTEACASEIPGACKKMETLHARFEAETRTLESHAGFLEGMAAAEEIRNSVRRSEQTIRDRNSSSQSRQNADAYFRYADQARRQGALDAGKSWQNRGDDALRRSYEYDE